MAIQTLSEVKAENEKLEQEEQQNDHDAIEKPDVEEELKKLLEDDNGGSNEGSDVGQEGQEEQEGEQEGGSGEIESWLADEDDEVDGGDGKAVPLSDHIEVRQKLKEKNRDLQAELDELKAGLQQQQQQYQQQQQPALQNQYRRPTLEDFDYDEDQFNAALDQWNMDNISIQMYNQQAQQYQVQQQQYLQQQVESHYERSAELVTKHHLDVNKYKEADHAFRSVVGNATGMGDAASNAILAMLGEGSEKVLYAVGRNKAKLQKLGELLSTDPSGLKASIFLGQQLAETQKTVNPRKKLSEPPRDASGSGVKGVSSQTQTALKKKYQGEADAQKRWNIRKKAKAAGLNVDDW